MFKLQDKKLIITNLKKNFRDKANDSSNRSWIFWCKIISAISKKRKFFNILFSALKLSNPVIHKV